LVEMAVSSVEMGGVSNRLWQVITGGGAEGEVKWVKKVK
jgi:hypothetical protein